MLRDAPVAFRPVVSQLGIFWAPLGVEGYDCCYDVSVKLGTSIRGGSRGLGCNGIEKLRSTTHRTFTLGSGAEARWSPLRRDSI